MQSSLFGLNSAFYLCPLKFAMQMKPWRKSEMALSEKNEELQPAASCCELFFDIFFRKVILFAFDVGSGHEPATFVAEE